ncbi:MAG: lipid-binding SYLF domain-containing protein [Gemmataceae bacterium]
MPMTPWLRNSSATLVLVFLTGPAFVHAQARRAVGTVESAVDALKDSASIPEKGIPQELLREAEAVAIIPDVIKVGFVVGGRHGKGVVLIKDKDGNWTSPIFVTVTGGSIGWQAGAQATDVVLVFKTKKSVERILKGKDKFTLGADAAVAAGPLGRQAAAATDVQLKAEIYSYSRSRGLFAGVSLDGSALRIDNRSNEAFYRRQDISTSDIVSGKGIKDVPEPTVKLIELLTNLGTEPQQKK